MIVGNDVCIAILWLVDLHVGVLPGKLLAWINGLRHRAAQGASVRGWTEEQRQKKRREGKIEAQRMFLSEI